MLNSGHRDMNQTNKNSSSVGTDILAREKKTVNTINKHHITY
jgi:hypothetical protein